MMARWFWISHLCRLFEALAMLGIAAPDFLLSLTGTMIHQELPCEVHHDLIVLGTWGMTTTMPL